MKGIVSGDNHLDMTLFGRRTLRLECLRNFDILTDIAIERKIDIFIDAGDLYDKKEPGPDSTFCASKNFGRMKEAGIETIGISGNHDKYSLYYGTTPGTTIFDSEKYTDTDILHYEFMGYNFYLLPYQDKGTEKFREMFNEIALLSTETKNNILVSHLTLAESMPELEKMNLDLVQLSDLPTRYFKYIFLGDIHKKWSVEKNNCFVGYTGSTFPTSITDMFNSSHCALYFDTEMDIIEFIDLPFRPFVEIKKEADLENVTEDCIAILRNAKYMSELQKLNPFHLHFVPYNKKTNRDKNIEDVKSEVLDLDSIVTNYLLDIKDIPEREIFRRILEEYDEDSRKESMQSAFQNIIESVISFSEDGKK